MQWDTTCRGKNVFKPGHNSQWSIIKTTDLNWCSFLILKPKLWYCICTVRLDGSTSITGCSLVKNNRKNSKTVRKYKTLFICGKIIVFTCWKLSRTHGVSIFIDYCTAPRDTEKGGRRGKRHPTDTREWGQQLFSPRLLRAVQARAMRVVLINPPPLAPALPRRAVCPFRRPRPKARTASI